MNKKNPSQSERIKLIDKKIMKGKTDDKIIKKIKELKWKDFDETVTRDQIKERRKIIMDNKELQQKFLKKSAMDITSEWIEQTYGKRCKAMTYGCHTCEAWMSFDRLFDDVITEYSWPKEIKQLGDDDAHESGKIKRR